VLLEVLQQCQAQQPAWHQQQRTAAPFRDIRINKSDTVDSTHAVCWPAGSRGACGPCGLSITCLQLQDRQPCTRSVPHCPAITGTALQFYCSVSREQASAAVHSYPTQPEVAYLPDMQKPARSCNTPLFLHFLQEAGVSGALIVQPSNHQYKHRHLCLASNGLL
jgi:hypothetical protein